MSRFKSYIMPFLSDGSYSPDWIDVSDDTDFKGIGKIKESIDASDFEVGLFKFNEFGIKLNNLGGKYADVGSTRSIFAYKRTGSKIRITWQISDDLTQCGNAICGEVPANLEVEVFKGLLNDESLTSDIKEQIVRFKVLGFESIFNTEEVPFSSISNGQTLSTLLYTILNQAGITELVTVSQSNINPDYNPTVDDVSFLENTTVKEALDEILKTANSVLYIKNGVLYITSFAESATVKKRFFGQGSEEGIEDIVNITSIRSGLSKTFNFWTWLDTTLVKSDPTSINLYGIRKREADLNILTDTTKRNDALSNLLAEYKDPKQEFMMSVPLNYKTLELFILDKIEVDYPIVYRPVPDGLIPYYGSSIYGQASYPLGDFAFSIDTARPQKLMERKIDLTKQIITFKLRDI